MQHKEALNQKWLFSQANFIFYKFFTAEIEIKSYKLF
jgi:hypothetical protein